jgi:hypothetical protein
MNAHSLPTRSCCSSSRVYFPWKVGIRAKVPPRSIRISLLTHASHHTQRDRQARAIDPPRAHTSIREWTAGTGVRCMRQLAPMYVSSRATTSIAAWMGGKSDVTDHSRLQIRMQARVVELRARDSASLPDSRLTPHATSHSRWTHAYG